MAKVLGPGPGDIIVKEGDARQNIYYVKSGKLNVFVRKDGQNAKVGEVIAGELVGEMAFIQNKKRSATVIAAEPSELIEVSQESFKKALDTLPPWLRAFINSLIKRLLEKN